MKYKKILAAAIIVAATACPSTAGDENWSHDWKAARARAMREKKDILIDFNGSDWCGWCIKLTREVFSQDTFKKTGPKHFILFEVDFVRKPENVAKQPRAVREQNQRLMEAFNVSGFPSIFLADMAGRPFARTGYRKGGPQHYLDHLLELKKIRVSRDEKFAKAKTASGVEKARLLDAALKALEIPLLPHYADEVNQILAADPDDTLGLKKEYAAKQLDHDVDSFSRALQQEGADYGKLTVKAEALADRIPARGEMAQRFLMARAQLAFLKSSPEDPKKGDFKILQKGYQKAIEAAPDSKLARRLKAIVRNIMKRLEKK